MLNRRYEPGFKVDLHLKDLDIVADFARSIGIALPLTVQIAQSLVALSASGGGELDHSCLIEVVRDLRQIAL